jgi:hypothetical protein
MVTLKYVKNIGFIKGCCVEAIKDTKWYKKGAKGYIRFVDEPNINVQFISGNYNTENSGHWWGRKTHFKIIEDDDNTQI